MSSTPNTQVCTHSAYSSFKRNSVFSAVKITDESVLVVRSSNHRLLETRVSRCLSRYCPHFWNRSSAEAFPHAYMIVLQYIITYILFIFLRLLPRQFLDYTGITRGNTTSLWWRTRNLAPAIKLELCSAIL